VAIGAHLGEDPGAHLLAGRAQQRELEERIALDERLAHRFRVRDVHRRIPDDLAFLLRLIDPRVSDAVDGVEQQAKQSYTRSHIGSGSCRTLCYIESYGAVPV